MKILFIILFLLTLQHRVFPITPEKLFTSERNKTFYIEHEHKYDWFESLAKCARMDMYLTAFDSKVKWDDVLSMIQKHFGKNLVLWTSGYAVGDKRQFMWMTTGEEFTFTNWTTGNPDFSEQKEYCVQIGNGPYLEWNDNTCTKKFGFICEFKEQQSKNHSHDKTSKYYKKLFTSERNKTFYIDHEEKYDWFESIAKCARMDMSLMAIDSKVKWDDVLSMIQKQFGKKLILWTSGYAVGEKREFFWMTTGEEFTFTNWTSGNPDFSEKNEYCVQIGTGPHSEWNDNKCSKKFGFICEFKDHQCNKYYNDKITQNYNLYFNRY
ncbi:hypothetical protein FF38_04940 [Lucilia cuprina]|uniref:C-type lectin domain-containing protein n=1 Tax=Lucilia cuprina TaxID=7375 RepID=A0A0L0C2K6_LUCCU|nr:hypothetical protein FF38_04940 [Lucilia cuprina]